MRCDRTIEEAGCVKSFCYLGDTIDGDGVTDLAATARIKNGWMKFRELLPFLISRTPPAGDERSSGTRPLLVDVGVKFEREEMQMIRWMCGISMKDRRTSEELRRLVGVESITTVIRSCRLRWYGHVMITG